MMTWLELLKIVDGQWVHKGAEDLQALPSCMFRPRVKYGGGECTTVLCVKFGCLKADHHHLWSECRQKGSVACPWVACPWVNKHGVANRLHKGGRLHQVWGFDLLIRPYTTCSQSCKAKCRHIHTICKQIDEQHNAGSEYQNPH